MPTSPSLGTRDFLCVSGTTWAHVRESIPGNDSNLRTYLCALVTDVRRHRAIDWLDMAARTQ